MPNILAGVVSSYPVTTQNRKFVFDNKITLGMIGELKDALGKARGLQIRDMLKKDKAMEAGLTKEQADLLYDILISGFSVAEIFSVTQQIDKGL